MKTLAIETSSARGSVAVLDDDRVLAERSLGEGARHGRDLVPCVDELLGGEPRAVDLLAVSIGPGSYTGLRIGVTFAKVMAIQAEKPVVGVSSLDVIAANFSERRRLCVVVDARLGQVYAAVYDSERRKVTDDIAALPEDAAERIEPETAVLGSGLTRYRAVFAAVPGVTIIDDETMWQPRAAQVGLLGHARFVAQGGDDPHALVPRYLRRPQAERIQG